MKWVLWRGWLPVFAVTLLLTYSAPAEAQNLALGAPVIDFSSRWNNQAQYDPSNAVDGVVCELDQKEKGAGMSSFWLGAEKSEFEYFTIDLGSPVLIGEIDLRNTRNAQWNDRATQDFQIDAAIAVDPFNQLIMPVTILTGTLSRADPTIKCPDEIPPDKYDSTSGLNTGGLPFQYLQFTALSAPDDVKQLGTWGVGLNEIEVYAPQAPPRPPREVPKKEVASPTTQ